jgi:hypothetical protein
MLRKSYKDFRRSFMKRLIDFKLPNSRLASYAAIIKIVTMIIVPEDLF